MTVVEDRVDSRHIRDELDFGRSFLVQFTQNLTASISANDLVFSTHLLNRAYNDDEPEYSEEDLIWRNPGYGPGW